MHQHFENKAKNACNVCYFSTFMWNENIQTKCGETSCAHVCVCAALWTTVLVRLWLCVTWSYTNVRSAHQFDHSIHLSLSRVFECIIVLWWCCYFLFCFSVFHWWDRHIQLKYQYSMDSVQIQVFIYIVRLFLFFIFSTQRASRRSFLFRFVSFYSFFPIFYTHRNECLSDSVIVVHVLFASVNWIYTFFFLNVVFKLSFNCVIDGSNSWNHSIDHLFEKTKVFRTFNTLYL